MRSLTLLGPLANSFVLYSSFFSIGNGQSDDLVVDSGQEAHVRFVCAGQTLSLLAKRAPIWVNGVAHEQFPFELAPGSVLSLSPDIHLYYGDEADVLPDAPAIVIDIPKKRPNSAKNAYIALVVLLSALVIPYGIQLGLSHYFKTNIAATAVVPERTIDAADFINEVLGEDLLAYIQAPNSNYLVRALANPQSAQQAEDLQRFDPNIHVQWVDLKQLLFHVKQGLSEHSLSKKLKVEQARTTFVLRGICVGDECAQLALQIEQVAKANPDALLVNEVRRINIDFKIIAHSISAKAAFVTLKRGDQMVVVPEGGKVFDLGRLNLITPAGITVQTADGPIFIPQH